MHEIFATFGIPRLVKADNGPPFNGESFENCLRYFGIKRRKITPLHPRANGEVERFMQNLTKVFKNATVRQIPWRKELN